MDYFHIQKIDRADKEWFQVECYDTNGKENNLFSEIIDSSLNELRRINNKDLLQCAEDFLNKDPADFMDYCKMDRSKHSELLDLTYEPKPIIEKLVNANRQYKKWIREEIFEKVRRSEYPDLPSRKKGIWFTTAEHLRKWDDLLKTNSMTSRKFFQIEILEGRIFVADGNYCDLDDFSFEKCKRNAYNYWAGNMTEDPQEEILFEGRFKVLKEYNSIGEIPNSLKTGKLKF